MTAPTFGQRGLRGAPHLSKPPISPPPPRRMRSNVVAVGVVGALALGMTGAAGYQEYRCQPPRPGEPDARPWLCFSHSGHTGGGHGWGFSGGGGSSVGHASFGGFGHAGAGHGGGS